ncbi:Pycsar system effector family protein [Lentzea sp. NPDC058450]|uniref:Pycsar system effector family protein n=1 Tax=Lentzea sp. NPDC058450 TaxID=3346505 RepID=UPI00365E0B20
MRCTEFVAIPVEQHYNEAVKAADAQVRDELRAADTKAVGLLGLFGLMLAGVLVLVATSPGTFATGLVGLAAGPIGAAVVVLLLVLRPVILRVGVPGASRWHTYRHQPEQLLADLTAPGDLHGRVEAVADLSAVLMSKHRRTGVAVRLVLVGLAVLAFASFIA